MDGELASEQQRSLPHAEEPERPARSKRTFIESNAVIMNLQRQTANLTGQSDLDFGGVRVPHDVGQRFLQHPENRRSRCCSAIAVDKQIAIRALP